MFPKDQMIKTIRHLSRKMFGKRRRCIGKHDFIPNQNHYHIVSFPKSGNTWLRFLLANMLCNQSEQITFENLSNYIPDSHRINDRIIINDPKSSFNCLKRQFVKSHSHYHPDIKKVIYLVRDGRDALASYYYWINARKSEYVPLIEIINGNACNAGVWSDHVIGWVNEACEKKLIIKYEDLKKNSVEELKRILSFAEIEFNDSKLHRALELSSVDSMKEIERKYGIFDGNKKYSEKTPFVRKGTIGDWINLFGEDDIKIFWKYHREAMQVMEYI